MKLKDCLYKLEDHPDLLAKFRKYIMTGDEAGLPKYLKKVLDDTKHEKRQIQLSAIKLKEALSYMAAYTKSDNPKVRQQALENLIASSYQIDSKSAGTLSIESRAMALIGEYHGKLADMMSAYRPRKFGFERSPEAQRELVRALYGDSLDVDAKKYAQMVTKTLDELVDRHNAAGGNIEKLQSYRLPQFSDPVKVGSVSFTEWYDFIKDKLDTEEKAAQVRAVLDLPDKAPVSEKQMELAFHKAYQGIRTRGASEIEPGRIVVGLRSKVAGRHQEHRFFHFKDAESWIKYSEKFGDGTPFSAVTGHIDRMSREIAAMEVLGPNPERNLLYLMDIVKQQTGDSSKGEFAYKMYKDVMGELNGVGSPKVTSALRDARNIMAATKLGSAALSAISDTFFLGSTAKFNGISVLNTYKNFFSALNPANEADRFLAGRIGLTMDYALDKINQFNRMSTVTGSNWTAKFADFALRANGLNHWTHAAEQAFGLEFMHTLGEVVKTPFETLDNSLRQAMQRYGITAKEWTNVANTPLEVHKDAKYFNANLIEDMDTRAKIIGMVLSETKMAVPSPTARIRTLLHQGQASGTVTGELYRTFGQFKSFPTTILINQLGRRLTYDSKLSRLSSISGMVIATTGIGALSYNLKELAKGRTVQDWETGPFWANGFVQGGGLGLIGDLLFMDPSKRGSLMEFMAGPLVGEANEMLINFVLKPSHELIKGEDKVLQKLADRAVSKGEDYVPAPLNLPFIRLALQRGVFDGLHKLTDPSWSTKQRRLRKLLARETNQEYWAEP